MGSPEALPMAYAVASGLTDTSYRVSPVTRLTTAARISVIGYRQEMVPRRPKLCPLLREAG